MGHTKNFLVNNVLSNENNEVETKEVETLPSEDELTQYAMECIEKYSSN